MGLLVDGQWQDKWYDTEASGGRFEREDAGFRNWVTVDGSAGPSERLGAELRRRHEKHGICVGGLQRDDLRVNVYR